MNMSEKVLDAVNWVQEAKAVKNDIQNHVKHIEVLEGTDQLIYLNLTTIEGSRFCVELSANGFRIVGERYGAKNAPKDDYFETPYSLLNAISPEFCKSFGNELSTKLSNLNGD